MKEIDDAILELADDIHNHTRYILPPATIPPVADTGRLIEATIPPIEDEGGTIDTCDPHAVLKKWHDAEPPL